MTRPYPTLRALLSGLTVDIEGVSFRAVEGEIEPGDVYIAERNGPPVPLTCRYVNEQERWIVPAEMAYLYDIRECIKVELA